MSLGPMVFLLADSAEADGVWSDFTKFCSKIHLYLQFVDSQTQSTKKLETFLDFGIAQIKPHFKVQFLTNGLRYQKHKYPKDALC